MIDLIISSLKLIYNDCIGICIFIECVFYKLKYTFSLKNRKYSSQKKIFYMMLPTHGNIGDQAIAEATLKLLNDQFSDFKVITVNDNVIYKEAYRIRNEITENDIIMIHGGGNMGDLYVSAERKRRFIVRKFSSNKILSFTQTAYFTKTPLGKHQLELSKKAYTNRKNLILLAREKYSYNFMKEQFHGVKIKLIPDIVFYLAKNVNNSQKRDSFITTCLRSDKESVQESSGKILKRISSIDDNLFIYDTYVARKITSETRKLEVTSLMRQFSRSKLIITDRMHGMVIAAITHTPCIVTKSLDYKILGTYEWLKDLNYIVLVNNLKAETLKETISYLSTLNELDDITIKHKYYDNFREELGYINE